MVTLYVRCLYYVGFWHQKKKNYYCVQAIGKHLVLSTWHMSKVRDRFVGMIRFMGGLRCKKRVNSVIIGVLQNIISLYVGIF